MAGDTDSQHGVGLSDLSPVTKNPFLRTMKMTARIVPLGPVLPFTKPQVWYM